MVTDDKQEEKKENSWEADLQTLSPPDCFYSVVIPKISLLVDVTVGRVRIASEVFPSAIVHSG